jgi:hypothetical protein
VWEGDCTSQLSRIEQRHLATDLSRREAFENLATPRRIMLGVVGAVNLWFDVCSDTEPGLRAWVDDSARSWARSRTEGSSALSKGMGGDSS